MLSEVLFPEMSDGDNNPDCAERLCGLQVMLAQQPPRIFKEDKYGVIGGHLKCNLLFFHLAFFCFFPPLPITCSMEEHLE